MPQDELIEIAEAAASEYASGIAYEYGYANCKGDLLNANALIGQAYEDIFPEAREAALEAIAGMTDYNEARWRADAALSWA